MSPWFPTTTVPLHILIYRLIIVIDFRFRRGHPLLEYSFLKSYERHAVIVHKNILEIT